jgi:hypothetical protein
MPPVQPAGFVEGRSNDRGRLSWRPYLFFAMLISAAININAKAINIQF